MPSEKPCIHASRCAAARSTRACHSSALHSESVFGETRNCICILPAISLLSYGNIAPIRGFVIAGLDPAIHQKTEGSCAKLDGRPIPRNVSVLQYDGHSVLQLAPGAMGPGSRSLGRDDKRNQPDRANAPSIM